MQRFALISYCVLLRNIPEGSKTEIDEKREEQPSGLNPNPFLSLLRRCNDHDHNRVLSAIPVAYQLSSIHTKLLR